MTKTFCPTCKVEVSVSDNYVNLYMSHITDRGVKSISYRFHDWCCKRLPELLRVAA